ncbi:hypothetical protein PV797_04445 [Clostridiaceae bacterium M8S5]|nr:hypothetical protein PV797_04445 [Clostridiaceae bacterium M8S5]
MSNIEIISIGLVIIASIIAISIFLAKKQIKVTNSMKVNIRGNRDFLYVSYMYFSQFILTRGYIKRVRKRIELLELSDSWTINRKTMKFTYILLGISTVIFMFMMTIDLSVYYFIISSFVIYVVHNQILKLLVDGIENKILMQFDVFIGDVRHHYHKHSMIEEAIYDSINDSDYEISLHADKMYEVLTSDDVEESIDKYNELVPNKYFRTFLALCYSVQKFGDKVVDGRSLFLTNLNYLKQEINLEHLRRSKIDYLFKSLSMIAIAPIFFIKIIETWAIGNIPELICFYQGVYGLIIQVILFLVALISYQLINKMQSKTEQRIDKVTSKIENYLLEIDFIYDKIENIIQKKYTRALKAKELLSLTDFGASIHHYYLNKILLATIGFIMSLIIAINIHEIKKDNILDVNVDSIQMNEEYIKNLEFDNEIILQYADKNLEYYEIENIIKAKLGHDDGIIIAIKAKRIMNKIGLYNDNYFRWWELIICIIIALIFYNIPYWMLLFRKKILRLSMEDEVMQFHTIIMMLIYVDRIAVEDILHWMRQFSVNFRVSIDRCINDFEYGDLEALDKLKADESFLPFIRIVENLESASDKISIIQAFDELKTERKFYQQKRRQDNEIIVNHKGLWGRLIAFTPMMLTLLLYTVLPFVLISIEQLTSYSQAIKDVL